MHYTTIKEIEEMTTTSIVDTYTEGKWIVLVFETGVRFKVKNW